MFLLWSGIRACMSLKDEKISVKVPAFTAEEWNRAIEESQRHDIEWSLNETPTSLLSEEKLTLFENVLGFVIFGTAAILLLPVALPVYFYMKHLDDKYDTFCP